MHYFFLFSRNNRWNIICPLGFPILRNPVYKREHLKDLSTVHRVYEKKKNNIFLSICIGYQYVNILRCNKNGEGTFTYTVSDDDGRAMEVQLDGAARDPFRSVGNCFMKLVKEDGKSNIKGIMVDDDWVEKI